MDGSAATRMLAVVAVLLFRRGRWKGLRLAPDVDARASAADSVALLETVKRVVAAVEALEGR